MTIYFLLLFTLLFCVIYQYILKTWWYFKQRNVKFLRGVPLLGTFYPNILGRESQADYVKRIYEKFQTERFFGVYDMLGRPSYMICDPELIKQVHITHFEHFQNHRFQFDDDLDPMGGRNLFGMRGEKWRRMRATMSPAFTGNKMRLMHGLIVEYTRKYIGELNDFVRSRSEVCMFEGKNLFSCYANDIIATCAFGIDINSLQEPNNEFFRQGQLLSNFEGIQGLKFFTFISMPWLMKLLKIPLVPESTANFFRRIIFDNIKQRADKKVMRNDMLDLLIKARAGQLDDTDAENVTEEGFATVAESKIDRSTDKLDSKQEFVQVDFFLNFHLCAFFSTLIRMD